MKKHLLIASLAVAAFGLGIPSAGATETTVVTEVKAAPQETAESTLKIRIVNFKTCVEESKVGKEQQKSFEAMKTQMTSVLEGTEKELQASAAKLNDADYVDSLSPEAEQELQKSFQVLSQEMEVYKNQYYQAMNQAQYSFLQLMGNYISRASESLAKTEGLSLVISEEACPFYSEGLDVTPKIVSEMDKIFTEETANQQQPSKDS